MCYSVEPLIWISKDWYCLVLIFLEIFCGLSHRLDGMRYPAYRANANGRGVRLWGAPRLFSKKESLVEHLLSFLQFCFLALEQGMSQVLTLWLLLSWPSFDVPLLNKFSICNTTVNVSYCHSFLRYLAPVPWLDDMRRISDERTSELTYLWCSKCYVCRLSWC